MTIFFTADTHFNHKSIIKYCNRPWDNVEEMNEALIDNWNSIVKPKDSVHIVGDFAFRGKIKIEDILKSLKGKKYLIEGNHDRQNKLKNHEKSLFENIDNFSEIIIQDLDAYQRRRRITLCHYAMITWREKKHNGYMLHGHAHGNFKNEVYCPTCETQIFSDCLRLDVGVDCHNYHPISYEEVKEIMNKKIITNQNLK